RPAYRIGRFRRAVRHRRPEARHGVVPRGRPRKGHLRRPLMAYQFSPGDVRYLVSADGAAAVATAGGLALTGPTQLADLTAVRAAAGEHAAAVAETVLLRRTARQRWGDGPWERWLFTDEALQQASPPQVAAHRAARIAGHLASGSPGGHDAVHDVTCSIGADLA